jgi:hypothetical protein
MADNVTIAGIGDVATRAVTYSGDANRHLAPTALVTLGGSDDAKTATDVPLPAALGVNGGLKVDIVGDTGVATTLDTDDGSVAGAQASIPLVLPLRYTWNGSVWVRGGWTPHALISAASTNATSVKTSAGVVGYICCGNYNAEERFLKLYNKASAPTVGTDTPVATFIIPGNTAGNGTNIPLPEVGMAFSTGIAYALTTGSPVADTGAVAVSEIQVNIGWL